MENRKNTQEDHNSVLMLPSLWKNDILTGSIDIISLKISV